MKKTTTLLLFLWVFSFPPLAFCNNPGDIEKIVNCSIVATKEQLALDLSRRLGGVDVSIADRTKITPDVIGGGDKDLSPLVTPAVYINNLNYCNKQLGLSYSIPTLLGYSSNDPFLVKYGHCPYKPISMCPHSMKFRRADGTCNNIQHPLWGSAKIPLGRFLPPQYEGNGQPRQHSVDSSELTSARLISTTVHKPPSTPTKPLTSVTSFYTGFGQFLSHDVTNTPTSKGDLGVPVSCCKIPNIYKCFNIAIPPNDYFYSQYNRLCMGLTRSAEGTDLECKTGGREQFNVATSFVDLSTVYGDSDANTAHLSDSETGKLKISFTDLLPVRSHQNAKAREMGFSLFSAGDPKINETPALIDTNLLFHREHNAVAEKLKSLNPGWDGMRVYQESRRIVIAYMQHIVYNEYLPVTLPDDLMNAHNLRSQTSGYDTGYDSSADATTSNIAATAALRFGHSMLNNDQAYANKRYKIDKTDRLNLKDSFFRTLSSLVREMDINRGQIVTKSEDCDRQFVPAMANQMFETSPGNGNDLASLNIQRGRDHGLPTYAAWRTKYNLHAPTDWTDASFPDHDPAVVNLLKMVNASPLDVDVYSAAVSEKPIPSKTVGPLFAAIIAHQFALFKKGDRFWYETDELPQRFTRAQLKQIRKITLARLMCDHYDVKKIQRKPFLVHKRGSNPYVKCRKLAKVNLQKWKE